MEFIDDEITYQKKISRLKNLVRDANYLVIFTGAGISTAANISDYSGENGLKQKPKPMIVLGLGEQDLDYKMPTFSHVAVQKLIEHGKAKFIVTSNHDDLHGKAGTKPDEIAELFGNVYVEKCTSCKKMYKRRVIVPNIGRVCDDPNCGGRLLKTGVRMNATTPKEPLELAHLHAKKANLALVLGSSMQISPFCELPLLAKDTVLCTMQSTSYDGEVTMSIHAKCDTVMKDLLEDLGIQVTSATYEQEFAIKYQKQTNDAMKWDVTLEGTRFNEPCKCVETVSIANSQNKTFNLSLQADLTFQGTVEAYSGEILKIVIEFKPNFHEPAMTTEIKIEDQTKTIFKFVKNINYS